MDCSRQDLLLVGCSDEDDLLSNKHKCALILQSKEKGASVVRQLSSETICVLIFPKETDRYILYTRTIVSVCPDV